MLRHEADHRTAAVLVHVDVIDLERMHREDVAMRLPGGGAAPP